MFHDRLQLQCYIYRWSCCSIWSCQKIYYPFARFKRFSLPLFLSFHNILQGFHVSIDRAQHQLGPHGVPKWRVEKKKCRNKNETKKIEIQKPYENSCIYASRWASFSTTHTHTCTHRACVRSTDYIVLVSHVKVWFKHFFFVYFFLFLVNLSEKTWQICR